MNRKVFARFWLRSLRLAFISRKHSRPRCTTMFSESGLAAQGALGSCGVSYNEIGRLSAKYVQRVLAGTSPRNLPVESLSRLELALKLKTARELGVTIRPSVLFRADKVIE
jgi:putative ABC transport system substrate-binding protein